MYLRRRADFAAGCRANRVCPNTWLSSRIGQTQVSRSSYILCEGHDKMNQGVYDDTAVFVLLLYFYLSEKLQSPLAMQSPIQGCSCIEVKEPAHKHASILALRACSNRL